MPDETQPGDPLVLEVDVVDVVVGAEVVETDSVVDVVGDG